ncbi:MAG: hypothetical protein JEZ11_01195 [Desulfobacterales bacterium]|nr:hypothetical protein [Desulfobacterales bacterium]
MIKNRITRLGVIVLVALLWVGCKNMTQSGKPEDKFQETDYLNNLAGIYEALLPRAAEMGRVVTLTLYSDGTCLLAEKDLGQPPKTVAIRYGRWDHSDFPDRINLHLSSDSGAKGVLSFERVENQLVHSGNHFGKDGLTLTRH